MAFFIAIGIVAFIVLPFYFSGVFPFWILFFLPLIFIRSFNLGEQINKTKEELNRINENFDELNGMSEEELDDFIKNNKGDKNY